MGNGFSFRGERFIDVINSTELRAVDVDVREIGLFPAKAGVKDADAFGSSVVMMKPKH